MTGWAKPTDPCKKGEDVMKKEIGRRSALVLPLAAAAVSRGARAQQAAPFKFGCLMPTTGPEAGYGLDFVKTYEMAVKEINANGGANGHPLEAVVLDGWRVRRVR